jgi:hypothetical protein
MVRVSALGGPDPGGRPIEPLSPHIIDKIVAARPPPADRHGMHLPVRLSGPDVRPAEVLAPVAAGLGAAAVSACRTRAHTMGYLGGPADKPGGWWVRGSGLFCITGSNGMISPSTEYLKNFIRYISC